MKLTSKQRAIIKSSSNKIKPTFQIGALEVHENNVKALNDAFNTKEVIKVKVNRQDKTDKDIVRELADELEKKMKDVHVVSVIGTTIILYKQHKDKDKRMNIGKK